MSDSNFRADVKEDDDNKDHGGRDSDEIPLDLRKEDGEFVDDKKDEESGNTTATADEIPLDLRKEDGEFVDDKKDEESGNATATADDDLDKKPRQSGEEGLDSAEEDDNDGFRTPTSIEHRIPVPTHCPPAPKKSLKRKFEDSSITDILRSATKAIHDHIMGFRKAAREDDDALS